MHSICVERKLSHSHHVIQNTTPHALSNARLEWCAVSQICQLRALVLVHQQAASGLLVVVLNVEPMQLLQSLCFTIVLVSHVCLVNQPILACLVHALPHHQQEQSCIGSSATSTMSL